MVYVEVKSINQSIRAWLASPGREFHSSGRATRRTPFPCSHPTWSVTMKEQKEAPLPENPLEFKPLAGRKLISNPEVCNRPVFAVASLSSASSSSSVDGVFSVANKTEPRGDSPWRPDLSQRSATFFLWRVFFCRSSSPLAVPLSEKNAEGASAARLF